MLEKKRKIWWKNMWKWYLFFYVCFSISVGGNELLCTLGGIKTKGCEKLDWWNVVLHLLIIFVHIWFSSENHIWCIGMSNFEWGSNMKETSDYRWIEPSMPYTNTHFTMWTLWKLNRNQNNPSLTQEYNGEHGLTDLLIHFYT